MNPTCSEEHGTTLEITLSLIWFYLDITQVNKIRCANNMDQICINIILFEKTLTLKKMRFYS